MLPDPLHPAIVHLPVVLMILLPLFAMGALWTIRRGAPVRKAWAVPLTLAAALTLSSWAAVETGENDGERVEKVVAEEAVDSHEEAAERFFALSGVLLLITGAGLIGGVAGQSARLVTTVGSIGLIAAGVQVGHSGGKLVYQEGAASAYTSGAAGPAAGDSKNAGRGESDDR